MNEEIATAVKEEITPEEKKRKRELMIYPACELAGGIYKSYFASYLSMLFTNIYMFSATLAAILETVRSLSTYVVSPLAAFIIDRLNFKTGKFWPYIMICQVGTGLVYILLFSIPLFAEDASKLAIVVFCINIVLLIFSNLGANAGRQIYARMCKTPKERSNVAMYSKVARDGMKTITGFIYPLILVALIAYFGEDKEPTAWALLAVIMAIPAMIMYFVDALWLKNSQFEKENVKANEAKKAAGKKKASSIIDTFKGIFTNRHMLFAFISYSLTKVAYFIFLVGGSYTWRYYFEEFSYFSFFSTGATLCAIIGAFGTPIMRKIFKDVKYTYAASVAFQALFSLIAVMFYRQDSPFVSMVIIFGFYLFNGIADTMSMPLFVGAADWANWKYKTNDVGLTMAIWGLGVSMGTLCNTWIRTAVLNMGGFDAAALKAGAAVPEALKQTLWTYNTVIPLALMVVSTILILIGYGLKDADIEKYRKENEARVKQGG